MRKALSISLVLAVALAGSAFAKPVDLSGSLDKFQYLDLTGQSGTDLKNASNHGVFGTALAGTTYFGGTFWAADSMRWEAIKDSTWTFATGVGSNFNHADPNVNPFKDPTLHAYMEGWVGFDNSYGGVNPYFRHMAESDFPGDVCVGATGGLGGLSSWWAGALPAEANDLCFAGGQGYGNAWNVAIQQTFAYNGTGPVNLSFDYTNDTETNFDYSYATVDTSTLGDRVDVATFTGFVSGNSAVTLTPGVNMRSDAGDILLLFRVASDGAYSDEDGLNATLCGAFAVDNVSLTGGGIAYSSDFEAGPGGFALAPATPGAGGDWSDIVALTDLPAPLTPCECALDDSVLVFVDTGVSGHGLFQDNLAASPWIDLVAGGRAGAPGKFIQTNLYAELPLLNYVFVQFNVQFYPQVCPNTGLLITSPMLSNGFVYYFGGVPQCSTRGGAGTQIDFSDIVAPGAEQMRIAVGEISYCRFFGNCTGVTNTTPWFDYVKLGVFGDPLAPFLNASGVDLPQDSFPQNGTLRLDAPGRVDANNVKGASSPEPGTSLGDTLIVAGGLPGAGANAGAEVFLQFAVDPGPQATGVPAWLALHTMENVWMGQQWYSAQMDTAESSGGVLSGNWMSAYHENDPNFVAGPEGDRGMDAADLDPNGNATRLANDIFPEGTAGLFTAGTRINMFYKARYVDAGGTPTTGVWFTFPDTTGGNFLEMEVLPSSAAADSTWNCTLYVDHFNRGAQVPIEAGLTSALPGVSGNFEQTAWDRWDVRAESSQQGSFGRPLNTQYGATVAQTFAYKTIIWNSGNLNAFNLVEEDANDLNPWLTLTDPGLGDNRLYVSGDGAAQSMTGEAASEPSALKLLEVFMGASLTCGTVRDPSCPGTPALQDTTACIKVDPVGGPFVGNSGPNAVVLEGNGCPQLRSFDLLSLSGSALGSSTPAGNESYNSTVKGLLNYHSIANSSTGAGSPAYQTVIDGGSVHYRRDASTCTDTQTFVTERLTNVLTWMGSAAQNPCSDPLSALGVGDDIGREPNFRVSLSNFAPNPLFSGKQGKITFTMPTEGKAAIDIFDVNGRLVRTLFDDIASEGVNQVFWNGDDANGSTVASGVYFYRLRANGQEFAKKMVVVRNGN